MGKNLHEWFEQVNGIELLVAIGLVFAVARHLVRNASSLSERRFVAMSALGGLLAVVAFGVAAGTPSIAGALGLKTTAISEQWLSWVKAGIALLAAGLSVYEMTLRKRAVALRPAWAKGIGVALAIVSIGAYFRFGDFGYQNFYHRHEFFHYYLGSKYDRELGYERIYRCVALAQADSGQQNEVRARKMMDLGIDLVVPAQNALDHPEECRTRFTPERWEMFKADVQFFRNSANLQYWNDMQTDHGYNPPPVWTVMGHLWSSLHPATDGYLKFLSSFDILYLAGMFAAIHWAFGWRVFAVAAVFWGCQLPAEYFWTGGAFMRQDWLFFLVLSGCLLRKGHHAWAGAAFAYSTLLRVFPGLLLAGPFVVAVTHLVRHRPKSAAGWFTFWRYMAPHHLRMMVGGLVATAVLVGASAGFAGWRAYPEFYHHIQVHNHTPLTNNVGLPTILAQSYSGRMEFVRNQKHVDAFDDWKQMRNERLGAFRPFHLVLVLAFGAAFVKVVRRVKSLWIAQALSVGVFVALLEVTCYYYSIFIVAAFLSRLRRSLEQWILCVAGISQVLAVNHYISYFYDDRYTWQSVLFCIFSVTLIVAYWPPKKGSVKEKERALAGPAALERAGGSPPAAPPAG